MKAYAILVFLFLSVTAFQAQSGLQASDTPGQNLASAASSGPIVSNLVVSSSHAWTDSDLDLHQGDVIQISAAGQGACDPDGLQTSEPAGLPVSTALPGALIAKIDDGTPFLIGSHKTLTIEQPGHLFLGLNTGGKPPCGGDIEVKLQLTTVPVGAQVKSKLSAAAQTWLSGQFGTGTPQIASSPGISGPVGNLVFAATPITCSEQHHRHFRQRCELRELTLLHSWFYELLSSARPGTGNGSRSFAFANNVDYAVDFNRSSKGTFTFRGGYAGAGTNPGWQLQADIKPLP